MRIQIFVAAILACVIPFLTSQSSAQERDASIQFESAKAAFDALASDSFTVRQAAEQYLKEASGEAIPVVIDAWLDNKGDSLEQKFRCKTIVNSWLDSAKPKLKVKLWHAIMLHPNRADSADGIWYGHPHFTRAVLESAIRKHFQGTGISLSWDYCSISSDWIESDADMAIVAAMPELNWISFAQPVSASQLNHLGNARRLERISIRGEPSKPTSLNADQIRALTRIESLTALWLTNTRLDADAAKVLVDFRKLVDLTFQMERPTDLVHVAKLGTLASLRLSPNTNDVVNLSADDLMPLTRTKLETLGFGACQLESDAFEMLNQIPNLNSLGFRHHDLAAVKEVLKNKQITSIGVSGTGIDSDRVAAQFAEATHLEKVSLSWSAVTDHGVRSLAKMTFLKQLNLMTNTASKSALKQLKEDLSANTKLTCDSSGNPAPEQSELLGELYEKGAWISSIFGKTKYFYIREELWTGSESDVERALKDLDWTRLVIDLPLTPKLVQVLKQSVDQQERYISVRDNGQHPQPMLERLRESGKFQWFEDRHGKRLVFDPKSHSPQHSRSPR